MSKFELSLYFAFLIWTKNGWEFLTYLDKLFFFLTRVEQSRLIILLNSFSERSFNELFKSYNLVGLNLKVGGKVAGYPGDSSKRFLINYGQISKSTKTFKLQFFFRQIQTFNGIIGLSLTIFYL